LVLLGGPLGALGVAGPLLSEGLPALEGAPALGELDVSVDPSAGTFVVGGPPMCGLCIDRPVPDPRPVAGARLECDTPRAALEPLPAVALDAPDAVLPEPPVPVPPKTSTGALNSAAQPRASTIPEAGRLWRRWNSTTAPRV
jgi:hypothetical protein